MTRSLRRLSVIAALAAALAAPAARAGAAPIPSTPAEHLAMAKTYQDKATAWRAEAALHRDMAADYRKAHPDRKSGARSPWTVEMERHCMTIVKDAETLAADAEEAARYHALRAKELEGK